MGIEDSSTYLTELECREYIVVDLFVHGFYVRHGFRSNSLG